MQPSIRIRSPLVEDGLPQDLHPLLRRIYLNRGLGCADELELSLDRLLPVDQFKGIEAAVDLLQSAIQTDEHILIVGDFDADGATSTALAIRALRALGARQVSYMIPDRFRFGYGLTPEIVEAALDKKPDLIVTVDNGISSLAGAEATRAAGVKLLITDHHLPGQELPAADAILNPNQPGCGFPSKNLAGVGVIFYLMAALRTRLRDQDAMPDPNWTPASLLDLVALGTVADVVKLDVNNRILVQQGLLRMRAGRCCEGIKALMRIAGRDPARCSAADLGFALGPRLNAAGRLVDMSVGIECLLADDPHNAHALAVTLDDMNRQRREKQDHMQDEALHMVESLYMDANTLPTGLCVYHEQWHEGVVGLVASRLKETHHRPAIAFAPSADGDQIKGSARSIAGVHIRDILDSVASQNPGLISKFGGHAMAAGLSLAKANFDAFRDAYEQVLAEQIDPALLEKQHFSDGELTEPDLSLELAELLESAGPWGQGFAEPAFHGEFEVLDYRVLKEKHLKMKLQPVTAEGVSTPIDAIAFNVLDEGSPLPTDRISLLYRVTVNNYANRRQPQMIIEEIL